MGNTKTTSGDIVGRQILIYHKPLLGRPFFLQLILDNWSLSLWRRFKPSVSSCFALHYRQFWLISFSVDKCLRMCGLEAYADAVVGLLNLACQQPRLLLFLDEPTSGLDSQSAWAIITFLCELADSGQAILYTWVLYTSDSVLILNFISIHQHSGELLTNFSSFARAAKLSTLVTSLLWCCNTSNIMEPHSVTKMPTRKSFVGSVVRGVKLWQCGIHAWCHWSWSNHEHICWLA
jgi:hypothetical protein